MNVGAFATPNINSQRDDDRIVSATEGEKQTQHRKSVKISSKY